MWGRKNFIMMAIVLLKSCTLVSTFTPKGCRILALQKPKSAILLSINILLSSEGTTLTTTSVALVGSEVDLWCNTTWPSRSNSLILVIWYKDGGDPVYRCDSVTQNFRSYCVR